MRLVAVLLAVLAVSASASTITLSNGQSCTYNSLTIDPNGTAFALCAGSPAPQPSPQPTPQPTPTPTPPPGTCAALPSNAIMQTMFIGGTNNYVFDDRLYRNASTGYPGLGGPQGTIQVFPLPLTWRDGTPVTSASVQMATFIYYNQAVSYYEVAFSPCPGDFTYYTSPAATVYYDGNPAKPYYPCGLQWSADMQISWSTVARPNMIDACYKPAGAQWYMNWRVVGCPGQAGYTCGQTFYIPKS